MTSPSRQRFAGPAIPTKPGAMRRRSISSRSLLSAISGAAVEDVSHFGKRLATPPAEAGPWHRLTPCAWRVARQKDRPNGAGPSHSTRGFPLQPFGSGGCLRLSASGFDDLLTAAQMPYSRCFGWIAFCPLRKAKCRQAARLIALRWRSVGSGMRGCAGLLIRGLEPDCRTNPGKQIGGMRCGIMCFPRRHVWS